MSSRDSTPISESPSSMIPSNTEEFLENKIEQSLQTDEENIKEYLGDTLVPLLAYGIDELEKIRPHDPITFLAHFLLRHNPKKSYQ